MNTEDIFNILIEKFPNTNLELDDSLPHEAFITWDGVNLIEIATFLRDSKELLFDSLMNLSGVDDNNKKTIKNEDGTETIDHGTLSVYYHLHSMEFNHKVTLKVSVSRDEPKVESVESIWKTADWHEREAYDMFGIIFLNHPNLERILLPYDWEEGSYPLRKDFETPEFYNGMKIPY